MKRKHFRVLAAVLAAAMITASFAGCGSKNGSMEDSSTKVEGTTETENPDSAKDEAAGEDAEKTAEATEEDTGDTAAAEPVVTDPEDRSFSWLLDMGETGFYDEYEENPAAKWWTAQSWDAYHDGVGQTVSIDFITPPTGSETDNFSTLLATREYPDVIGLNHATASVKELYEEGVLLDLTEYVNQYMPNYLQWIEDHPDYEDDILYQVDGEKKHLQIYNTTDEAGDHWGGYLYRRDWIVKYGTNPETGEAFTGSYAEDGTWTDDVVFPSGNTDPIYISDWEWMFEIFEKALSDLGLSDGYCVQMYYPGYIRTGEIVCGFGGIIPWYYVDKSGTVRFGADSDGMRAYLSCMHEWYERGWLDQGFDERSDIFFQIDSPSVYSGSVGCWYGMNSQVLDALDDHSTPALEGICAFCAPQPINDKYGTAAEQNVEPVSYFLAGGLLTNGIAITEKAKEKDLPTLLTAIDYLYSTEGGLLRSYGFSDVMQQEVQDPFYMENGLEQGAYHITRLENGEDAYVLSDARNAIDGLGGAAAMIRVPGNQINHNLLEEKPNETYRYCMGMWKYYDDTANGGISAQVTERLSTEVTNECTLMNNNMLTYMDQTIPAFITGAKDISDDAAWEEYCGELRNFGYQTYVDALQDVM